MNGRHNAFAFQTKDGIPAAVFSQVGVPVPQLFERSAWIPILAAQ
jgi:hypothetical protein